MAFIVGPRQVGKTTTCSNFIKNINYYNWDNQNHREKILGGPDLIAEELGLNKLMNKPIIIVFDEIHKYSKWKIYLKGFFDVYQKKVKIIVTGSSRLDIYKRSGDSLMGRYLLYHMHPLSVRELTDISIPDREIQNPGKISQSKFNNLLRFGGYPEPFLKKENRFYNQWKNLKEQQLFKEDLRDLTRIQDIDQIHTMALLIKSQAGQMINYSNIAKKINISVDTVRRWINVLESLYYCFLIRPWSKNVAKSLIKDPKCYLWDWSVIEDKGIKNENFIASHLLKYIHWLTDNGFGKYGLYFIRDKNKREVDFLVVKNNTPWFLIEVKSSQNRPMSKELIHFRSKLKVRNAFQVVFDMPYIDKDCFSEKNPVIVPAQTLLSQLI